MLLFVLIIHRKKKSLGRSVQEYPTKFTSMVQPIEVVSRREQINKGAFLTCLPKASENVTLSPHTIVELVCIELSYDISIELHITFKIKSKRILVFSLDFK